MAYALVASGLWVQPYNGYVGNTKDHGMVRSIIFRGNRLLFVVFFRGNQRCLMLGSCIAFLIDEFQHIEYYALANVHCYGSCLPAAITIG